MPTPPLSPRHVTLLLRHVTPLPRHVSTSSSSSHSPLHLLRHVSLSPRQLTQLHCHLITASLLSSFHVTRLLHLYASSLSLSSSLSLFRSLPSPPSLFAFTSLLTLLSRLSRHRSCLAVYARLRSDLSPDRFVFPPVIRSAQAVHVSAAPGRRYDRACHVSISDRACHISIDSIGSDQACHVSIATIHADCVKFCTDGSVQVANALVTAYGKTGNVSDARKIFDLMSERNLLSYNSLISAYCLSKSIDRAVELVKSMRFDGIEPDLVTHNTLINGFCQTERIEEAIELLEELPNPNVVSWTALICGLHRRTDHDAALDLFRRMMWQDKVKPDSDILSCVISSCKNISALKTAREVQAYGLKSLDLDLFYCSAGPALVKMYASCKKISAVESVFRFMDLRDVVSWNAILAAFVELKLHNLVFVYLKEMRLRGICIDETTLVTVLQVCDLNKGKEIHGYLIRQCNELSNIVSNSIICMYARNGCINYANKLFDKMRMKDIISYNTMIGAFASHGLGHKALDQVHAMFINEIIPDGLTLTNALNACTHCGLVSEGLQLFQTFIKAKHIKPTMEQYACIISLLSRAGRFKDALNIINEMPIKHSASLWGAFLAACGLHNNVEFAKVGFENLVLLEPQNPGNYITMSNIYMSEGRLDEARAVRESIEGLYLVKPSGFSEVSVNC